MNVEIPKFQSLTDSACFSCSNPHRSDEELKKHQSRGEARQQGRAATISIYALKTNRLVVLLIHCTMFNNLTNILSLLC